MQFGTFITELAQKAGIDTNDKSFTDLLSANVTIPDAMAERINSSLFNFESAKQNSQLKGYFHSQALSVPDKAINEVLEDMQFDDTVKHEFQNEKSTPAKIKKLAEKIEAKNKALIAEIEKNSSSKDSKERIENLSNEIKKLNADLLAKDNEWQGKLKEVEERSLTDKENYLLRSILAAKKYADKERAQEVNVDIANLLLEKELSAKKAKRVLNPDGSFKLVQADNPDLEYMENHKSIPFGDFVDRTLANNKMLEVTAPQKTVNAPITPAKGDFQVPQSIIDSYDRQLKVFANGAHA